LLDELTSRLQLAGTDLVRGAGGIAEGLPPSGPDLTLPKFRDGGLLIVHAGGGAGLFSAIIGGWASGAVGSAPVTKEIGTRGTPGWSSPPPESGAPPPGSGHRARRACATPPSGS